MKVIISGGGTGGHIFPAIAIGQEIKRRFPSAEVLFIGANGRMEMEQVPKAGFEIKGLDVAGFNRTNIWKNLSMPFKLLRSLGQANSILKKFKPSIVIGVGGYASAPTLFMANRIGIPTIIQEQNSFAGKTNKILAKKAKKICVAYDGMDKFFDQDKIVVTGNPVRDDLSNIDSKKSEAIQYFGLDPTRKTVLVMGGSLGAGTLNNTIDLNLELIEANHNIQWIWQYGKQGIVKYDAKVFKTPDNIKSMPFIERVDLAFAAADVILCRAGALTISEILIAQRPAVLVPSPIVAEDHQTHNAMALVSRGAALFVKDAVAPTKAIEAALNLLDDDDALAEMKIAQAILAKPRAAEDIVDEMLKLIPTAS